MKQLLLLSLVLCLSACSSVSVRTDGQAKSMEPADFHQRYRYWFWGLKGHHSINVREVCQGKKIAQVQTLYTFTDSFLGVITAGIYTPRTARVWCKKEAKL